jgi:hypothetical protein
VKKLIAGILHQLTALNGRWFVVMIKRQIILANDDE